MPGSYCKLLYHCVFATQDRLPLVHEGVARELYPYMASILPSRKGTILKVGGTKDHVHVLLELSSDTPVAEAMRLVKANSSKWLNGRGLCSGLFRWQSGFSPFTVSVSARDTVESYIARQHQHHRRGGFAEELAALLRRHGIEHDGPP